MGAVTGTHFLSENVGKMKDEVHFGIKILIDFHNMKSMDTADSILHKRFKQLPNKTYVDEISIMKEAMADNHITIDSILSVVYEVGMFTPYGITAKPAFSGDFYVLTLICKPNNNEC